MKRKNLADEEHEWLIPSWIGFRKFVPTDLGFSCMYPGNRVEVRCYRSSHSALSFWVISIGGTDASDLVRFLNTQQEALAIYNRVTYIQSVADLVDFLDELPGANNNSWPSRYQSSEDEELRRVDHEGLFPYEGARRAARRQ
jgi:hypothetical protein